MNNHSEYSVALTLVSTFDPSKPTIGELGVLEAFIPTLMTALLEVAAADED